MSELNLETLFTDEAELDNTNDSSSGNNENIEELEEKEKDKPIEVNENDLFSLPEGVDGEGKGKGKDSSEEGKSQSNSSPNNNFYSKIATSFKEDGIFPDLSDDDVSTITDADSFAEAVKKQINAQLDDTQKRINDALENGVEPTEVQQYERTLQYLDSLSDDSVRKEGEEGDTLRKQLIFQDFINRGFTQERAKREMEKSFSSGSDVEDAIEALSSNREYFKNSYDSIINSAKEKREAEAISFKAQAEEFKKLVEKTDEPFDGYKVTDKVKKQILDVTTKPVERLENGTQLTAIQKYAKDNPLAFQHKLGFLFTLTDGFKNLDNIIKPEANKYKNKAIKEIQHTLNSTRTDSSGALKFLGGAEEDENSYEGLKLDI